jgi:hypothetical protein
MRYWTPDEVLREMGWVRRILLMGSAGHEACEIANNRNRRMYESVSEQLRLNNCRPLCPPLRWSA